MEQIVEKLLRFDQIVPRTIKGACSFWVHEYSLYYLKPDEAISKCTLQWYDASPFMLCLRRNGYLEGYEKRVLLEGEARGGMKGYTLFVIYGDYDLKNFEITAKKEIILSCGIAKFAALHRRCRKNSNARSRFTCTARDMEYARFPDPRRRSPSRNQDGRLPKNYQTYQTSVEEIYSFLDAIPNDLALCLDIPWAKPLIELACRNN